MSKSEKQLSPLLFQESICTDDSLKAADDKDIDGLESDHLDNNGTILPRDDYNMEPHPSDTPKKVS